MSKPSKQKKPPHCEGCVTFSDDSRWRCETCQHCKLHCGMCGVLVSECKKGSPLCVTARCRCPSPAPAPAAKDSKAETKARPVAATAAAAAVVVPVAASASAAAAPAASVVPAPAPAAKAPEAPVATQAASLSYYLGRAQQPAGVAIDSAGPFYWIHLSKLNWLRETIRKNPVSVISHRDYRTCALVPPARDGERLVSLADCLESLCATVVGLAYGAPHEDLQYTLSNASYTDREKLHAAYVSNAKHIERGLLLELAGHKLEEAIEYAVNDLAWEGVGEAERAELRRRCLPSNFKKKHLPSLNSLPAQQSDYVA